MKTFSAKDSTVQREWFVIDATDKVLGRVASEVARRLRGKHKPEFTPHVDTGDYIIVVNASKLRVTGNKTTDKKYYRHSGFPGGLTELKLEEVIEKDPRIAIEHAVKGMLPKNKLAADRLARLRVFPGAEHAHTAQTPKEIK